ncbi:PD-(D/E)XK nuclease family protein [Caenimonas aquaedulcis]|uniref:PD-(D/E)XK nuclease family protein n=1 Tax=Caenimonas aquaedulcis TaxID=2793270 RepID=A0A931MFT8_9BURK|nr:PD-(D/E)XK nuclease family protein [Caenimonas aquaedulcis]MBG9386750.1 PD-(D/E)XK nuclease family protein [Caenimonas aquaedulcis]
MDAIAQTHRATLALDALMSQLRERMRTHGAHPARTVVLMPFMHLLPLARDAWALHSPDGFTPRFETTQTWAAQHLFSPGPDDWTGDVGRDLLTAQALLERAGLGARSDVLAQRLVEAAGQLAGAAAAVAPGRRAAWAAAARASLAQGQDAPVLALEAAVSRVALEWAAASSYPGDALFDPRAASSVDLLVVVRGLRSDAFATALAQTMPGRAELLELDAQGTPGDLHLHEALDPADEAARAAACVLRHVAAGRVPVALPALDRILARRVRAMLEDQVAISDETGWKLSTTRAGAHVMLALRASTWSAGADAVLDWLKNAPLVPANTVLAIERRVRRAGIRDWRSVRAGDFTDGQQALLERVNAWRERLQAARPLTRWLADLRSVLEDTGQWNGLVADAAGDSVISALRLQEGAALEWAELPQASRRFGLDAFTAWVNETLEAHSFKASCADPQVVILPLHQMLGRPFASMVLAGCDETRLAPSPQPEGGWTAAQREVLGLPPRETLEAELRAAWRQALQVPHADLLWRTHDDSGESILASPLVQALQQERAAVPAADPRPLVDVKAAPTARPEALGNELPVQQLSASAYEDLRRCPYRFFAMRQLNLQEADEIDADLDKRDFGNWLHDVLGNFHTAMADSWEPPGPGRRTLLDITAEEVTRAQRFEEGEFLPFAAAWPQVRDGYLEWLANHEAKEGARFESAESRHETSLGDIQLVGRIDRIDALPDGRRMVMDYKTEARPASVERVRNPGEDTQLAFYAALLHDDTLRAAYINVGERGKTDTVEQEHVVDARDMLVDGILHDLSRIRSGEPLHALGEGKACEFCAARGLCRRDFWS